jgi:hypothetical protein
MIHKWSDCNAISKISIKVNGSLPGYTYASFVHKIAQVDKSPILIQFPLSLISRKNKNWIIFQISLEEIANSKFNESISQMIDKIKLATQRKYSKTIFWDTAWDTSCFVSNKGNSISINARMTQNCKIFEKGGECILDKIELINESVDLIVEISSVNIISPIITKDSLHGKIIIDVIQIRRHKLNPTILTEYAFDSVLDSNNENSTQIKSAHADYNKYFDMLKKGVPRRAVEQRITCDGLDVCILDGGLSKPPSKRKVFAASDLQSFKLKKNLIVKEKYKPKSGVHLGISFDDIQNKLKGLRKTKFADILAK